MRIGIFLLLGLVIVQPLRAQIGAPKVYEKAAVSSAESHASRVGVEIIRQGGNAVDAAIAVQFALAVTLPRAGNIGGGGFMIIRMADGEVNTLDFREKAPGAAGRDMYVRDGTYVSELSRKGGLAVGVPGIVDGMVKAHQRYGSLPWKDLLAPAIQLAEEGHLLGYEQALMLNRVREEFLNYDASTTYFTKADVNKYEEEELFVQKDLAQTLKRIRDLGRNGFYSGITAQLIVDEMDRSGGIITSDDLRNYESVWRKPVTTTFRGYELHMMPPPSSGGIAIAQILGMIDPFDLEEMGFGSAAYQHLLAEAMRRAFADRSRHLGDPDYWPVPVNKLTDQLYLNSRMESFDPETATSSSELSYGVFADHYESDQTTHYSVIDDKGNAVAVTTTLNGSFGSKVAVSDAGFLLNNEMDDFSAQPGEPNMFGLLGGEANAIEPGKRMLSSMSPMIVTRNDSLRMVIGAAGGPRIITSVMQQFLNQAIFNMNAQQAISAPRIHHQWFPDVLYHEAHAISRDTETILQQMGHKLGSRTLARVHALSFTRNGFIQTAVDPRGSGTAFGF